MAKTDDAASAWDDRIRPAPDEYRITFCAHRAIVTGADCSRVALPTDVPKTRGGRGCYDDSIND
jgi:hypothetical protein